MISVTGIRFQRDGKVLYYDSNALTPTAGQYVVAETSRGHELGEVVQGSVEMEEDQVKMPLPRLIRIATSKDIQQATDNRNREREAYHICQKKIVEHKLEMKLVSVETSFDNSKMLFYFTANGRVDFRALVKDLASTFKTRIELRQIGVRDEARMLGGLGPCGRPICCGQFLNDFQPVSIKMAKEQNLSLNPTKISGVCGRLMCCLKYEQDQYEQTRKRMPRVGREVITPDGRGTVAELNILKETVSVRISSGDSTEIRSYPLEQISRPGAAEEAPHARTENEREGAEAAAAPELKPAEQPEAEREPQGPKEEDVRPAQPRRSRSGRKPSRAANRDAEKESAPAEGEENREAEKAKNRTPGKNRPAKEQKLGQPVRRENRGPGERTGGNRKRSPEEASQAPSAPESRKDPAPEQGAQRPPRGARSRGWADALEKAMQEAGRESSDLNR